MSDLVITEHDGMLRFTVRLTPRASRTRVDGVQGGALRVRLPAPPVDGAANAALVALIAKRLEVPVSCVRIVRGVTSRTKLLQVARVGAATLHRLASADER